MPVSNRATVSGRGVTPSGEAPAMLMLHLARWRTLGQRTVRREPLKRRRSLIEEDCRSQALRSRNRRRIGQLRRGCGRLRPNCAATQPADQTSEEEAAWLLRRRAPAAAGRLSPIGRHPTAQLLSRQRSSMPRSPAFAESAIGNLIAQSLIIHGRRPNARKSVSDERPDARPRSRVRCRGLRAAWTRSAPDRPLEECRSTSRGRKSPPSLRFRLGTRGRSTSRARKCVRQARSPLNPRLLDASASRNRCRGLRCWPPATWSLADANRGKRVVSDDIH